MTVQAPSGLRSMKSTGLLEKKGQVLRNVFRCTPYNSQRRLTPQRVAFHRPESLPHGKVRAASKIASAYITVFTNSST